MKYLLSLEGVEQLSRSLAGRSLLAFDFDGTLAPLVTDHRLAKMTPRTSELFERVCVAYPCAVISGRGRDDVAARLGTARPEYVIGNHGLEPGDMLEEFAREMSLAKVCLETALAGVPGVELEDKRYSLSLHYLHATDGAAARHHIADALATIPHPIRAVEGKMVVNVVPPRAPNKGDALLHLRKLSRADVALYVGDDVTDEDVFDLARHGGLFTVRVGWSAESSAEYYVRDQLEVDALLEALLAMRSE